MCDGSILLPYCILAVMLLEFMTGAIVMPDCLDRYIFAYNSEIYSMYY